MHRKTETQTTREPQFMGMLEAEQKSLSIALYNEAVVQEEISNGRLLLSRLVPVTPQQGRTAR